MRKLMFAIMALVGFTFSAAAQQAPKKADKAAKETKAPAAKKMEAKATLKKDGTPDKRFKAPKAAKAPLKKDGTPDKRYKENKK